jgi:hypothetical protein
MAQAKIYVVIIKREKVEGRQKAINWETVEGNENNRFPNEKIRNYVTLSLLIRLVKCT